MDAFTGEIRPFAFGFAPQGWAPCAGQILPIQRYTPLFSLIGTTYGGNGSSTFALPNIQGYVLNGQGPLPGGSTYSMGEVGGTTGVTLLSTEMPAHNHTFNGATTATVTSVPTPATGSFISNSFGKASPTAPTAVLGRSFGPVSGTPVALLNPLTVGFAGSNLPHNNMSPYVVISYCICLSGIFPSRN